MTKIISTPSPFQRSKRPIFRGDRVTGRDLADVQSAVSAIGLSVAGPARVIETSQAVAKQFQVTAEYGDYITCREFDGVSQFGPIVYVAKPWLLRQTPFDGKNRNGIEYYYEDVNYRRATKVSNSLEIYEEITPPYHTTTNTGNEESYSPADVIFAIRFTVHGVFLDREQTVAGETARYQIQWLDINSDQRCWARV